MGYGGGGMNDMWSKKRAKLPKKNVISAAPGGWAGPRSRGTIMHS